MAIKLSELLNHRVRKYLLVGNPMMLDSNHVTGLAALVIEIIQISKCSTTHICIMICIRAAMVRWVEEIAEAGISHPRGERETCCVI